MNEWLHEWMFKQINEWLHEWMFKQMNEWLHEWMFKQMNWWLHEWMFKQMNQAYPQEKLEDQLHWRTPLRKYQTWLVYEPVLLHSRPPWRPSWIVLIVQALFFFRRILNNSSFASIRFTSWQFAFVFKAQMLEMAHSPSSNHLVTAILNCPDAVMTVLPFGWSFLTVTNCLECPSIMITVPFCVSFFHESYMHKNSNISTSRALTAAILECSIFIITFIVLCILQLYHSMSENCSIYCNVIFVYRCHFLNHETLSSLD